MHKEHRLMKKILTGFLLLAFAISLATALPSFTQEVKTAEPAKKAQGEITADSDQYIIGPEDVLHIYVWREESLTKQVPVRIDGKISLPLVDDVQAAGLTPLQLKNKLTEQL